MIAEKVCVSKVFSCVQSERICKTSDLAFKTILAVLSLREPNEKRTTNNGEEGLFLLLLVGFAFMGVGFLLYSCC